MMKESGERKRKRMNHSAHFKRNTKKYENIKPDLRNSQNGALL